MNKKSVLILCFALSVAGASAHAARDFFTPAQKLAEDCGELLTAKPGTYQPATLRLVNELNSGYLPRHSDIDIATAHGILPRLNRSAVAGILSILKDPTLTTPFLEQLQRLGLLSASLEDDVYVEMYLVAHNQRVDLTKPHADPIIQKFMAKKRVIKRNFEPGQPLVLEPISSQGRTVLLLKKIGQLIDRLDPADTGSVDVLNNVFLQVYRSRQTKQLDVVSFQALLSTVDGYAQFKPKSLTFPSIVDFASNFIPYGQVLTSGLKTAYDFFTSRHNSMKPEYRLSSTSTRVMKQVPQSVRIRFVRKDIFSLEPKMSSFIQKYMNPQVPLFSPQFAADFVEAYPELKLLDDSQHVIVSARTHLMSVEDGPFGRLHIDSQRVLTRAALAFSLLRGSSKNFSKLSRREFTFLRKQMLTQLGFLKDRVVSQDEIDLLMTFLVIDVLGRTKNPLFDAIDEEFSISKRVGDRDYERRAFYMLSRYNILSPSFMRQSRANQDLILSCMDGVFEFNFGQILRLEGYRKAFRSVQEISAENLNFVFYRDLLTLSGTASETTVAHAESFYSLDMEKWFAIKSIIDRVNSKEISPDEGFKLYLGELGENYGLIADGGPQELALRLSVVTGAPRAVAKMIEEKILSLPTKDRNLLIKYGVEYSVLFYDLRGLWMAISNLNPNRRASIGSFIDTLVKVVNAFATEPTSYRRFGSNDDHEVRVFLEPLVYHLSQHGLNRWSEIAIRMTPFKYGYVADVR